MLYPFSLTLDLYIQAESFEEAKKLAEAYVQDASLDTTDYPEIVQDVLEVAESYGYASFICDKHIRETDVSPNDNTIRMAHEQVAIDFARSEGFSVSYKHNSYGVRYIVFTLCKI